MPDNLERSILFTQEGYMKLAGRIKELADEQAKIEKECKAQQKKRKRLDKLIAEKMAEEQKLEKKHEEKLMLKFGDTKIDLKVLDALEPTQ